MQRFTILVAIAVVCWAGLSAGDDQPKAEANSKRVLVTFDFESRFDNGEYGRKVGELIHTKIARSRRFIVPEAMLDVREVCRQMDFRPAADTPVKEVGRVVKESFEADIAVWGTIERVPPNRYDVYDVTIRAADFSQQPPRLLYSATRRTRSVSEIPHKIVPELLERLGIVQPKSKDATPSVAGKKAEYGPNLIADGTFERLKAGRVPGWDPLPPSIKVVGSGRNHFLRMHVDPQAAATTGVLLYSDFFPIQEGATYRLTCRYRSDGPSVKVFVKCYDEFPLRGAGPRQRREVYRSQQNLKGTPGAWHDHAEEFTPRHDSFTPRLGRVMLYAYWPGGTVDWDDIVVQRIDRN